MKTASMASFNPHEAQANAQALADSFAAQEPDGFSGAPGDDQGGPGDENPAKRKYDGQEDFEEANRKRGSYTGPDTNGVRCPAVPAPGRLSTLIYAVQSRHVQVGLNICTLI